MRELGYLRNLRIKYSLLFGGMFLGGYIVVYIIIRKLIILTIKDTTIYYKYLLHDVAVLLFVYIITLCSILFRKVIFEGITIFGACFFAKKVDINKIKTHVKQKTQKNTNETYILFGNKVTKEFAIKFNKVIKLGIYICFIGILLWLSISSTIKQISDLKNYNDQKFYTKIVHVMHHENRDLITESLFTDDGTYDILDTLYTEQGIKEGKTYYIKCVVGSNEILEIKPKELRR